MYFAPIENMSLIVSSCAFRGRKLEDVVSLCKEQGLNLEFSSGVPYRDDLAQVYLDAGCKKLIHNYYPAPKEPFVLNLASLDEVVYQRSIDHCLNCLRLTAQAGSPFFSVHSGFRYDPDHRLLGTPLKQTTAQPREKTWPRFLNAVKILGEEARQLGVEFYLENSVLAQFNVLPNGDSPFFCCEAEEMLELQKQVNLPSVGFLLDTGHWKVSSNVLKFDIRSVSKIFPFVRAFHHSDNDGQEDTNGPLHPGYWFLRYMPHFSSVPHVLEVLDQSVPEIRRQFSLLSKAARG